MGAIEGAVCPLRMAHSGRMGMGVGRRGGGEGREERITVNSTSLGVDGEEELTAFAYNEHNFSLLPCLNSHIHTHTHTHSYTHTHTHLTCAHRLHAHTHTYVRAHNKGRTHTYTNSCHYSRSASLSSCSSTSAAGPTSSLCFSESGFDYSSNSPRITKPNHHHYKLFICLSAASNCLT